MKKLILAIALLSGCYSVDERAIKAQRDPKHSVLSQNEPIEFTDGSEAFMRDWFSKTSKWPTQADVDAWEKANGRSED